MSASGVLARVAAAAAAAKSSAQDVTHVTRVLGTLSLVHRSHAARTCARAFGLQLARRTFATAASAPSTSARGRPKAGSEKVAKKGKAVTKPKATKKKKSAAKPVKKTTTTKKKKVLTPKQKEAREKKKAREEILELKEKALSPPKTKATRAWPIYVSEQRKGNLTPLKDIAVRFKSLGPAEVEHYNHLANQNKAEHGREYEAWIQKHTPDEIRLANNARKLLRRRISANKAGNARKTRRYAPIKDERQVKGPQHAFALFFGERMSSGDFRNILLADTGKRISQEWKELSPSEKKKFDDLQEAESSRYAREYRSTYGHAPPAKKAASSSA